MARFALGVDICGTRIAVTAAAADDAILVGVAGATGRSGLRMLVQAR